MQRRAIFTCILYLASCISPAQSAEVLIAAASNFLDTLLVLESAYERRVGGDLKISAGSTGKLYAQVRNGAPYDVFLAADAERPRLLEAQGLAVTGSRFTYAVGRLALWSPAPRLIDTDGAVLERGEFRHLAIANPRLAPYGAAAQQVLEARGLWSTLQSRLVRGENIGQTYQFVASGSAELGFVAYSQIKRPEGPTPGSFWLPPQDLYTSIEQQAVLLHRAADNPDARAFLEFLRSEEARSIIASYGYGLSK